MSRSELLVTIVVLPTFSLLLHKGTSMTHPASPIDNQSGRSPLDRDSQQWVLDWMIQETGKTFHFQGDDRGPLPKTVKSHAMIPKALAQRAKRFEDLADIEAAAGHPHTALDLYFTAADNYANAQHPIFVLNDLKRFLYDGLRRTYDRVIELAPYRIEHLTIPWEGTFVSGLLHLNPSVTGPAPLVFSVRGCDVFKEGWPNPTVNEAHQRGMHIFVFEGPGQAECTMRGIRLTADNYERAASTALDHLVTRKEIDPDQVVVLAGSFGSFWGMRFAALDPRIKAIAAPASSLCEKSIHMDLESPRWKQLFAFITQAESEEALDQTMRAMTMKGYMEKVTCPAVITVGEFDARSPLAEMFELFDQIGGPAELWVMADQHHTPAIGGEGPGAKSRGSQTMMLDWLADRLDGKPLRYPGEVLWIENFRGPNSPNVQKKRAFYQ